MDIIEFQGSIFYKIAIQGLAYIFYVLLIIYLFYKISNLITIKKLNFKDEYKNVKKEFSNTFKQKFKIGKILGITLLVGFILYIIGIFLFLFIDIIIFIFTGFGMALSQVNNPIIKLSNAILNISSSFFYSIPFIILIGIPLFFYGFCYYIFIKGIFVNIHIINHFKNNNL